MPVVAVSKAKLLRHLGREYTDEEFDKICFDFGLELDDIETVGEDPRSAEVTYKLEVPANRYDLLCFEGISRALNVYLGNCSPPVYDVLHCHLDQSPLHMIITPTTKEVRPYVVCAILRNIIFTPDSYDSFIDLQDKLHQNICRRRTLASVGTHDLDTIQPPFTYDAKVPKDIKFVPLNSEREYDAVELMELYSQTGSHLKPYVPIIKDKRVYPVIYDSNGVVLSLPPIINGNHSKISLLTRNVFLEVTAVDANKANIVLNTLVTMFSEYCSQPFSVEAVEVRTTGGERFSYTDLPYRKESISSKDLNMKLGLELPQKEICRLLTRMMLPTNASDQDADSLSVEIPPTRADVIHACDILEDFAISYGYNQIARVFPDTNCTGNQFGLNHLTDRLREQMAMAGYVEILTFSLCSRADVSTKLNKEFEQIPAVQVANPKTLEFQVARTTLLPGILKTIAANRKMPLPMKLFEISDVVTKTTKTDVGAQNRRHLCAIFYGKTSGFETIHGLFDRVMQLINVQPKSDSNDPQTGYFMKSAEGSEFFPGRCADLFVGDLLIGNLGILHPNVIANFDLTLPCAVLEIDIEHFL